MHGRGHFGSILFSFLTSVLAFFLLSVQLSAASPALNAEVKPSADGKTVTVVFSVENNPGIAGFRFTIHYDNKILKPVSAAMNSKISGGMFVSNLEEATDALNVVWVNGTNYTGNGELCSASFSVIGTLKNGKYPITVTYDPDDLVIIDSSQNPKTTDFEVKGMTASALTVSTQSEQSKPGSSPITGSQATNSNTSSVSSVLSAFSSSASSAETSEPSIGVNSQIRPPDYTGSAPASSITQSSQTDSVSQGKSSENIKSDSSDETSISPFSSALQSSAALIPVQSPGGESPDLLLIAVSVIAAATVIVLAVLLIKRKKQQ